MKKKAITIIKGNDMKILRETIQNIIEKANVDQSVIDSIKNSKSISPFTPETRILAYLISINAISYDDFDKIYIDYVGRYDKTEKYLYLFDMAPRTFGQTWGEQHILKLYPEFEHATKENLAKEYPDFDGEFDLWLPGIRIEVKACRANSTKDKSKLSARAYSHAEAKQAGFKYHYQQLKPSCCDVFIWIGVCKDELIYWVLSSDELKKTGKLGSQHRNENTGIDGAEVFEGQVFMTEEELSPYLVSEDKVLYSVKNK